MENRSSAAVPTSDPLLARTDEWFAGPESRQDLQEVGRSGGEFRAWVLANVENTETSTHDDQSHGSNEVGPTIKNALSKSASFEEACSFVRPFLVIDEVGRAVEAHSEISRDRAHGLKRMGRDFEKFASTFLKCLRAFKGVVDIAGSADPGFIGVAYESLNIMFTVVAMKQSFEENLIKVLDDMKECLPDLIVYDQIYRNAALGRKIAAVYKNVVRFSRETTKYYLLNHGMLMEASERWKRVLSGKQKFNGVGAKFQRDLLAVKNQCELLLGINVIELRKDNKDLKERLDKLLQAESLERLIKFRGYLKQLPSHELDLERAFNTYTELLQGLTLNERVEHLSTDTLLSSAELNIWVTSPVSQLLILAGNNDFSVLERDNLSWLSPPAIGLIGKWMGDEELVLYYLCQETAWHHPENHDVVPQKIFASLLYQLLKSEPQVLQDDSYASMAALLEDQDVLEIDLNVLVNIFAQFLRLCRKGKRTYIVIDRADRCREESCSKVDFLEALARMVKDAEIVVLKVLLVVNKLYWTYFDRDCKKLEQSEVYDSGKFRIYEKNQQRRPDRW